MLEARALSVSFLQSESSSNQIHDHQHDTLEEPMNKHDLMIERQQIVEVWSRTLRSDWNGIDRGWGAVDAMCDGRWKGGESMPIRKTNDLFGWRSGPDGNGRDLCRGAFYRTVDFIRLPQQQRSGRKEGRTVHIEHTVPIRVLADRWVEQKTRATANRTTAVAWTLVHCVCTALHHRQEAELKDCRDRTECFETKSPAYLRPFKRYDRAASVSCHVWDVVRGVKVDADTFTFAHHYENVLAMLKECGTQAQLKAVKRIGSTFEVVQAKLPVVGVSG